MCRRRAQMNVTTCSNKILRLHVISHDTEQACIDLCSTAVKCRQLYPGNVFVNNGEIIRKCLLSVCANVDGITCTRLWRLSSV